MEHRTTLDIYDVVFFMFTKFGFFVVYKTLEFQEIYTYKNV